MLARMTRSGRLCASSALAGSRRWPLRKSFAVPPAARIAFSTAGEIGITLPGRIWNNRGGDRDIGLIGRSGCDLTDDPAVLVGGNMGLKAMRQRARAVLHPGSLFVALAGRADHRRVDERSNRGKRLRRGALADCGALRLKIARDCGKEALIEPMRDKQAAKAHEGGALGRLFIAGKTAKAAKARPVTEHLGQRDIGKIVPRRKQQRLEHRQRRPGLLALGG